MFTRHRHLSAWLIGFVSGHVFRRAKVATSIAGKRQLLQSDRSAKLFIDVLYHYRAQRKYLLHDFVVMPDHCHLLITIGSEISIERAVQFIKGGFAFRAGKELAFLAPVWERGFSEIRVKDAETAARVRDYIRCNPVKKGLVQNSEEYAYSSGHSGFESDDLPPGLKPVIFCSRTGTSEDVP